METIVIKIEDEENKRFLLNLLKHFKFIKNLDEIEALSENKKNLSIEDIKECFGIWKDREITKDDLRNKAWRKGK